MGSVSSGGMALAVPLFLVTVGSISQCFNYCITFQTLKVTCYSVRLF